MSNNPYKSVTYFALALNPIHVGTGGYRLGRVDNTIIREPGTNLPKIPGTSLNGIARAYTAMNYPVKYQRIAKDTDGNPKVLKDENGNPKTDNEGNPIYIYESCAGKGGAVGEGHCGQPDCPVCVTYGFSKEKNSFQGLVQFSDARILFFPVHSMAGPVWVTNPSLLREHGTEDVSLADDRKLKLANDLSISGNRLNLGWLMLESEGTFSIPDHFQAMGIQTEILNRLVLISDKLFTRIVNDNLEVRTSVAIDPATGAAEEGALYTYEAIPRATVLWFSVTYNDPKNFQINKKPLEHDISWLKSNVEKGLNYVEHLGVGGMGTRGMGRMRVLNLGVRNDDR